MRKNLCIYFDKYMQKNIFKVQPKNSSDGEDDQPKVLKSTDEIDNQSEAISHSHPLEQIQSNQNDQDNLRSINSNQSRNHSIFEDLLEGNFPSDGIVYQSQFLKVIMISKNVKKIKKVTNQPKHYFRKFMNCSEKYLDSSLYDLEEKRKVKSLIHSLNYKARSQTKKITMKDMTKLLLPGGVINGETARKNRKIFSFILRSDFCENSQSKNKVLHMIASRIYSLRCRSAGLVIRNAIH